MSIIDAVIRKCCCAPGDPKSSCCLLDSQYWRNAYYLRVSGMQWTARGCYSDDPAIDCTNPATHRCCTRYHATVQVDGAVFRQPVPSAGPLFVPCGSFSEPICCPDQYPDAGTPGGCACPDPWVPPDNDARPFGSAVNSTYRSVCCETAPDYFRVRYTGTLTIEEAAGNCDQMYEGVPVAFPETNEPYELAGRALLVCMDDLTAAGLFPTPYATTVDDDPCLDGSVVPPTPFPLHALVIEPTESLTIDNYQQYTQGPLTWAPPTLVYIGRLTRYAAPNIAGWTLMHADAAYTDPRTQDGSSVPPFCANLFDPANDPCWQPGYYPGACPEDLASFQPLDPAPPVTPFPACQTNTNTDCVGCTDFTFDAGALQVSTVPFQD